MLNYYEMIFVTEIENRNRKTYLIKELRFENQYFLETNFKYFVSSYNI